MSRDRLSTAKHCCFDMVKSQKCIFKGQEILITKSLTASAYPGSEHPHGSRLVLQWFYQGSALPLIVWIWAPFWSSIPPFTALSCSPEASEARSQCTHRWEWWMRSPVENKVKSKSRMDKDTSKLHPRLSLRPISSWHPKVRQNVELCTQWKTQSWIPKTASTICVPVF